MLRLIGLFAILWWLFPRVRVVTKTTIDRVVGVVTAGDPTVTFHSNDDGDTAGAEPSDAQMDR